MEPEYISFEASYMESAKDLMNDSPDMFARISIDGYPDPEVSDEGTVIATATITHHGDIVVDWHHNGYRQNSDVLAILEEVKQTLTTLYVKAIAPTYDTKEDPQTPFDFLRDFIGAEMEVVKISSGGYAIQTEDGEVLVSSGFDKANPRYVPAMRLKHHVGHKVTCVGYGTSDIQNVSIECEDCDEVLFDIDAPTDESDEEDSFTMVNSPKAQKRGVNEHAIIHIMKDIIEQMEPLDAESIDFSVLTEELTDAAYLLENCFSDNAIIKVRDSTTNEALYDLLKDL